MLTLLDPTVVTGALASCEIVVKVPCKIWPNTGCLSSALEAGLVGWEVRVEKKGCRGEGETGGFGRLETDEVLILVIPGI